MLKKIIYLLFAVLLFASCSKKSELKGELKVWHTLELSIPGPETSEFDAVNPFLDYRLEVIFTNEMNTYKVPGFYAADGNAAETSAEKGNIWKVRFTPDKAGDWTYAISFRKGKNIVLNTDFEDGEPVGSDGFTGSFVIVDSDKNAPDFRAFGRVVPDGHYLKHLGTGDLFLKGGSDSPENFLAYIDFDQTYRYGTKAVYREGEANPKESCHKFETHIGDWKAGDPTWQGGKGKGIIGALNYLASKGVNSQYMLTFNIQGDGKDVWPYSDHNERYRFDCSKLDQWEIVFNHMDKLGMMIHFVLQETENECLLDGGHTDVQRKLYLRELVARFGHHLAVTWNLGEENGPAKWTPVAQTDKMRKDMANYLKEINPYPNDIVLHTHANDEGQDQMLTPLLGFKNLDGASMQIGDVFKINERVAKFVSESEKAGRKWVVCLDEIGQAWKGVMPDEFDQNHDTVRHQALWGSLMAGAGGVEWYFGYRYPNNDLMCEDFRSRDIWWDQSKAALDFFRKYIPYTEMKAINHLIDCKGAFCFSKAGEVCCVYFPINSKNRNINLKSANGQFNVKWYNPRTGGEMMNGSVDQIDGGNVVDLGTPPSDPDQDWVALVEKI